MPTARLSSPRSNAVRDAASRVLFYSHDGFGLGHLRRNLKLAERLLQDLPGASALLLAGFPGTPSLDLPAGIDLVKLPSIRKTGTDTWEPRRLRIDVERLREMRRALLASAIRSFEPHLVLVDYLPLGVWSELLGPLSRLRLDHPGAALVLGLRDVLDAPLVTRRTWRCGGHDDAVRRLFDAVLVYGDRDLYDTSMVYGLDELAPEKVLFTGYVCPDRAACDTAAERRSLGVDDGDELILVTAGGGADAGPMMRVAIEACGMLESRRRRVRALVVTGPLMPPAEVAELERQAAGHAVTVQRWRSGLETTMAAADVTVTMAAYNTLTEAVRCGRPVISIPRPGPSAEQTTRARLFAQRGLVRALAPAATPAELALELEAALERRNTTQRQPPALDGLTVATERLRSLLARATAAWGAAGGVGRLA